MFTRRRRPKRGRITTLSIPDKANGILNIILILLLLVVVRVWHLAVIQHDTRIEAAQRPTFKTVIEPAKRATIRDRFNVPLALNKMQYQAAIIYSQLREVPSIVWEKDSIGKRVKIFKRREYVTKLAELLGKELHLDPERLVDLIHSKAAFSSHMPYVIKEEISETQYYRLKMLEKDWPGIYVREIPKRHYPKGRLGADIIGYMGAISRTEYNAIVNEMHNLEAFLENDEMDEETPFPSKMTSVEEVRERLKALEEKAYTINDYVGKTGVEGKFEQQLRGFYGKKVYYSDAHGNYLREMEHSRSPVAGNRILLTISSELQEYAEKLLMQQEEIRQLHVSKEDMPPNQPWIRGGAIVALDPNNGEVLALATYPRYDPNDFVPKGNIDGEKERQEHLRRWFESEKYIAAIWDQKQPLERERFNLKTGNYEEEKIVLSWENYLNFILPKESEVRKGLASVATIKTAVALQNSYPSGDWESYLKDVTNPKDKLLVLDLCRLAVCGELFSQKLLQAMGNYSLDRYKQASSAFVNIQDQVKTIAKELFHHSDFKQWRTENEKEFLKLKRTEEKENKQYAKPYIDYLDRQEKELFEDFWSKNRWQLVLSFILGKTAEDNLYTAHLIQQHNLLMEMESSRPSWYESFLFLKKHLSTLKTDLYEEYLSTMRSFEELKRPLLGKYRALKRGSHIPLEKDLAAAFYPLYGYGYARSYAYRQAASQGSIFKVVTAYAALIQHYQKLKEKGLSMNQLNPLTIDDHIEKQGNYTTLGNFSDGTRIPLQYKGGKLIKSLSSHIGKVDLISAMEHSSNPYFSILAGEYLDDPEDLAECASAFSYGQRTGLDLPGEVAGALPKDLAENRTGLYACAIGQHTLVMTPMQSAIMLSAIANGGKVLKAQIINAIVPGNFSSEEVHFPPVMITRQVPMPNPVRNMLLEGMRRVVTHIESEGIMGLSRVYQAHPEALKTFKEISPFLVGKTSSAEAIEFITLDKGDMQRNRNHIWFGGIAFEDPISSGTFKRPELVVIVYLRHGGYGKDTAPVAAQIVKKWREIKRSKGI
jgi:cell division protein FtsI/penicillin-binding protein 2